MRKNLLKALSVFMATSIFMATLTGCSSTAESGETTGDTATTQTSEDTIVLKLGHVASLDQPYHIAAEQMAKDVYERTNGQVEIQVFPNSQLGGQRDLLEGLQFGTVDIAFTSSAVLGNFVPTAQVIDLPFLFRDSQHVYDTVDGPLADEIYAGAEDLGMKVLSTWENGFRNIGNNIRPVVTPADMEGIKIRVFESQLYIDMFTLLGAIPTPMAMSEVFTGLQQKTIDGVENAVVQCYASKYQEVMKYYTIDEHTYNPQVVCVSLDKWNQISPENQEIVMECMAEGRDYNRSLAAELSVSYLEEMEDAGVEVTHLTTEQKDAFKEAMLPVWEDYYDIVGKDLIDKIVAVE